jgi:hypothetical protein
MTEETGKRKKEGKEDVEGIREVLGVVSKEVPSLIRGIIASVFSEEAGRDMGKGAAAFYKELKQAGMPEEVAVRMTENYIATFTNLGEMLKRTMPSGERMAKGKEAGEEISKRIQEKLAEKRRESQKEEEEED